MSTTRRLSRDTQLGEGPIAYLVILALLVALLLGVAPLMKTDVADTYADVLSRLFQGQGGVAAPGGGPPKPPAGGEQPPVGGEQPPANPNPADPNWNRNPGPGPLTPAEAQQALAHGSWLLDRVEDALDAAGNVVDAADLVNAVVKLLRGKRDEAFWSLIASVPVFGSSVRAGRVLENVADIVRRASRPLAPQKRPSKVTVLGHYPEYVLLSDKLQARRFDISKEIWDKMTKAERWAANKKYLDRMIARGDEIILATRVKWFNIKPGSPFERELLYLFKKGYRVSPDGTRLLPPK